MIVNRNAVAGFLFQVLRQQIAQHDLGLAGAKAGTGSELQRIHLVGIGRPSVDQRIHVGRQIDQIEDQRSHRGHLGQSLDFRA